MIQSFLLDYKGKVDERLKIFFEQIQFDQPLYQSLLGELKDFILIAGKRLRPALFYLGYKLYSDSNLDEIEQHSIFLEFTQAYLLIHDDIMDEDEMRRGRITVHKKYGEKFDERTGSSIAIIIGNIANHLANKLIPNELKQDYNEYMINVNMGQAFEIMSEYNPATQEDILRFYQDKTAYYSFIAPLVMGAKLAGSSELDKLKLIAKNMGIAFQIQDDIIDIFSNETGKDLASDFLQGKKTLLLEKTFSNLELSNAQLLRSIQNKSKLGSDDIEFLRLCIRKSGSLDYCKDLSQQLIVEAKTLIRSLNGNQDVKQLLIELCDYITHRIS